MVFLGKCNCMKGSSLVEIVIASLIFAIFMGAIFVVFETGLKSWQLGATKSDLHQKAEMILGRITKDFNYSNLYTAQIHHNGDPNELNEYICFETPVKSQDGTIELDEDNFGAPVWQGHVIYYIKPRFEENNNPETKRILYKSFVPRTPPYSRPVFLINFPGTYIDNTLTTDDNVRVIARDLYSIDFNRDGISMSISVMLRKDVRKESSVAFSPSGKGIEIFELSTSVNPKN